jgi:beta-lactamase class A
VAVDLAIISPTSGEASDGRIVLAAPDAAERIRLSIDGSSTPVRIVARRATTGGVRLEVQTDRIDREGADLKVEALDGSGRALGTAGVADVHLLGEAAFTRISTVKRDSPASQRIAAISRGSGSAVGISAVCLGSGRLAESNADSSTRAASTLKVAILLTALASDTGEPTRGDVFPIYRQAIVDSSNDAANRVLVTIGGGSAAAGAARVNTFMAKLGTRQSYLDGPYAATAGRSRKTTTAYDLRVLATALQEVASGKTNAHAPSGVTRHEARVLIGLMAAATYPGLVRSHVPGPVAHKAGWLDGQQNDAALVYGGKGGPCVVGITTEGLSFAAADALGRRVANEVLPALGRPTPVEARPPSPASRTQTTTGAVVPTTTSTAAEPSGSTSASPSRVETSGSGGVPWRWILAGTAIVGTIVLAAARRAQLVRRRVRLRDARRAANRRA